MKDGHPTTPPIPKKTGRASDDVAGFMPGDETEDDEVEAVEPEPVDTVSSRLDWSLAGDQPLSAGPEVIQELVKRLPNRPGVYRMLNAAGDVLYVG